jgi:hypothetical protein
MGKKVGDLNYLEMRGEKTKITNLDLPTYFHCGNFNGNKI